MYEEVEDTRKQQSNKGEWVPPILFRKVIAVMLSRRRRIEIALRLEANDFRARKAASQEFEIIDVVGPFLN